jgi:hypothetical protein
VRKLFTERHGQGKPRTAEILDDAARTGLLGFVSSLIDQDWFGLSFAKTSAVLLLSPIATRPRN